MYTALPTPTLWPTITYFSFLFILPTGNTKPAFEDLDLPAGTTIFALPAFPLDDLAFVKVFDGAGLGAILSKEPVLAKAVLSFFFSFYTIGTWMGAGGGGGLLSKRLSGILDTASTMVALL